MTETDAPPPAVAAFRTALINLAVGYEIPDPSDEDVHIPDPNTWFRELIRTLDTEVSPNTQIQRDPIRRMLRVILDSSPLHTLIDDGLQNILSDIEEDGFSTPEFQVLWYDVIRTELLRRRRGA